jgi:hypothetical protein
MNKNISDQLAEALVDAGIQRAEAMVRIPRSLTASVFTTFKRSVVSLFTTLLSFAFSKRILMALRTNFLPFPTLPNSDPFSRVL